MAGLESVFRIISDLLWNHVLLVVLVGLGIFYTFLTGGIQVRCFGMAWKSMFGSMKRGKGEEGGKGTFSSYQTLCTAVASCVGSGNIVGVATAILAGGPGALFWMWAAAFFGMATKFAEITLGVRYHGQGQDGSVLGGPMYYASLGLNWKHVGVMIASCLFIQNAGATLVQSNTISQVASEAFRLPLAACALGLAAVMTFIISGGLKRLVHIAERVVPFMAGFYVAGGLVVLLVNLPELPGVIGSILEGAFSLEAGAGAAAGISMREAMRYGVARGLYVDKAYGLNHLLRRLNVGWEEVVCCGDSFNDISMLRLAGVGVAMKNGCEELKLVADYVTEQDNNHNGIVEVIRRFFTS